MNIEQAKAIPMSEILNKLGHTPNKQDDKEAWYKSPFRNEKTASFKVHLPNNKWHDYGDGSKGDVVSFVCEYLKFCKEDHNVSDALRWLGILHGDTPRIKNLDTSKCTNKDSSLVLKEAKDIEMGGLKVYLRMRVIPIKVAKKYLKEVHVHNTKTDNRIYALGLKNEEGGYELRNDKFKGCVNKKDISHVRGLKQNPRAVHIFEGMFDFLAMVSQQEGKAFSGDAIILNSIACLEKAIAHIKKSSYTQAFTWLDNDEAGEKATKHLEEFFKTEMGITHYRKNYIYKDFKDVNEWHVFKAKEALAKQCP
jgi:5S rRNA maturation endonuclease (ribonuclease M5)